MTSYAIQAGALRTNPNSGPDGVGVQADIAYTLEARAEVQAVASISNKAVGARAKEPSGGQVNVPDNDNRPIAVASNSAVEPSNDNHRLTFISMFSGIEAASVAFGPLGWKALAFAEIEKFPSAVLAHHYPDVPNVGDMTAHDWSQYRGKVDIVCGGPPCQAFSVAGLRNSMADARGNLSLSYMRALHAIKPRNAIVENVPGWLNTPDNAFGCFLAGLVGADAPLVSSLKRGRWPDAGMVAGPEGRAAWRILDAQYFGLAQRRRRVIVIADFGIGADPAAVLFEPESVCRNSPPSREAGEGVTGAAKGGAGSGGYGLTPSSEVAPCLRARSNASHRLDTEAVVAFAPQIARCDATREGSSQDYETTTMLAVSVTGQIAHTLKAEGADASEDGTGRGTPIVATSNAAFDLVQITSKTNRSRVEDGLPAPTMSKASNMHVAQTVAIRGREGGATAELGGEVATALRASQGGGDKPHVLAECRPINTMIGLRHNAMGERTGLGIGDDGAPQYTLTKEHSHAVQYQSAVRRLTAVECERLQGFKDDYTNIPWRGKPTSPDGPRYKALGNSWAVPLFAWLGKRIDKHMPPVAALAHNDNKDCHLDAA